MLELGALLIVGILTAVVGVLYAISAAEGRRYWWRAQSGVVSDGAGPFREMEVPAYYRHSPVAVRRAAFASMWFGAILVAGAIVAVLLIAANLASNLPHQPEWLIVMAFLLSGLSFATGAALFNASLDMVYRVGGTASRAGRAVDLAVISHLTFLAATVAIPLGLQQWSPYWLLADGFLVLALLHIRWLRQVVQVERGPLGGAAPRYDNELERPMELRRPL